MGAHLHDVSLAHDCYGVGVADGAQPVRHYEGCPASLLHLKGVRGRRRERQAGRQEGWAGR